MIALAKNRAENDRDARCKKGGQRLGLVPPRFLCGVALMVECVVEVPCLHYADGLRRTYGGKTMIVTVLALYSVRCASYALLDAVPGGGGKG